MTELFVTSLSSDNYNWQVGGVA